MERSYAWFLGANDLGSSGGSGARRVLRWPHPTGVNVNEGAESTLMWLTAVEHIRAFRDVQPPSQRGAELLATSAR